LRGALPQTDEKARPPLKAFSINVEENAKNQL
jgi:hypothetical protein